MRKNVILPYKILNAHALSASFDSAPVNVQYLDNIAIQLQVTTNANTGLFTIQASVDGTIWDVIPLIPPIAPLAGVNDILTVGLNQVPYTWIKIHFEIGTGTNGHVTAYLTAKEL